MKINNLKIEISDKFTDGLAKRYQKYFRFNNSKYWKNYYSKKIASNDIEREKMYSEIIAKYIPLNGAVVDIGSGFGFLAKELYNKKLNVKCVDLFDEMIAEAKKYLKGTNVEVIKADILQLPFEKKSLDCISLESVIEHFSFEEVKEDILPYITQFLKDDGYLFIHTPVKSFHSTLARFYRKYVEKDLPSWAIDDDGDITHKIWISYEDYISLIEKNGYKIVNYDFRTVRSNMKPKFLYDIMNKIQSKIDDSDEKFNKTIEEESSGILFKKMLRSHLSLTSYLLFRKSK